MTKRKANPQRVGRKTKYSSDFDEKAFKYALLGLTDAEMAKLFGVSEPTFIGWKKNHPTFLKSIVKGKDLADAEVTHSLYERSTGYKYMKAVPIKVKEVTYENGKRLKEVERVEVTMVEEIVPPDGNSMRYWLNNRRRTRPVENPAESQTWADRHEVDHTTGGDKLPAPQVYMPVDLPADIVGDVPGPDDLPGQ